MLRVGKSMSAFLTFELFRRQLLTLYVLMAGDENSSPSCLELEEYTIHCHHFAPL